MMSLPLSSRLRPASRKRLPHTVVAACLTGLIYLALLGACLWLIERQKAAHQDEDRLVVPVAVRIISETRESLPAPSPAPKTIVLQKVPPHSVSQTIPSASESTPEPVQAAPAPIPADSQPVASLPVNSHPDPEPVASTESGSNIPDQDPEVTEVQEPAQAETQTEAARLSPKAVASTLVIADPISQLTERVPHQLVYPPLARRRGWAGKTVLEITVLEGGALAVIRIKTSSGHTVLDDAAREAVQQSFPLTAPQPAGTLSFSVVFDLQK